MKKITTLILFLLLTLVHAEVVTVKHSTFTSHYNTAKHEPDFVVWDLTPAMLTGKHFPRTNKFITDPAVQGTSLNKDYAKSGFDKGHQSPAEDNAEDKETMRVCFMFTNMIPQTPELNRQAWKLLEAWSRKQVTTYKESIHIVSGGLGEIKTIGPDHVQVPAFCWKAIKERGEWIAFIMPNTATVSKGHKFTDYQVAISTLDKKLGFKVEDY